MATGQSKSNTTSCFLVVVIDEDEDGSERMMVVDRVKLCNNKLH